MRVDFNCPFKGYDGRELTGNNIAMSVAEALFNYGMDKPVSREEKFKAYVLFQKIVQSGGVLNLESEDVTLIKEVCGDSLTAGGYGQVYELVERKE